MFSIILLLVSPPPTVARLSVERDKRHRTTVCGRVERGWPRGRTSSRSISASGLKDGATRARTRLMDAYRVHTRTKHSMAVDGGRYKTYRKRLKLGDGAFVCLVFNRFEEKASLSPEMPPKPGVSTDRTSLRRLLMAAEWPTHKQIPAYHP